MACGQMRRLDDKWMPFLQLYKIHTSTALVQVQEQKNWQWLLLAAVECVWYSLQLTVYSLQIKPRFTDKAAVECVWYSLQLSVYSLQIKPRFTDKAAAEYVLYIMLSLGIYSVTRFSQNRVHTHRIWPYIWKSPWPKNTVHAPCVYMVLANPMYIVLAYVCWVGQNHTFIGIFGVLTVLLGKSPHTQSYTVCI
jgi:hypothetical protein